MNFIGFSGQEVIQTISNSNFLLRFALSYFPGMRKAIKAGQPTHSDINMAYNKCSSLVSHGNAPVGKMIEIRDYPVWVNETRSQFIRSGRRSLKSKYSHFLEKKLRPREAK